MESERKDWGDIRTFENLECWKKGRELRNKIFKAIEAFPKSEEYGLKQNMKRASYSVTENIAEGYGRYSYQENIQFCRISRGSAYEILDQVITATDNTYFKIEVQNEFRVIIYDFLSLINGYINYLEKQKNDTKK